MNSIQVFWFVALAVADRIAISPLWPIMLGEQLDLAAADLLGAGLVDEEVAALLGGVGVVRHDLDALGPGLLERAADRVGVVGRDQDRVLALLGQRVDVGDLRGGGGVGRADLLGLAPELRGRLDARLVDDRLVRVVDLLGQEGELQALLDRRVRVGLGGGRGRRRPRGAPS